MPQRHQVSRNFQGTCVVASRNPTAKLTTPISVAPLLAADVGGTHVRVGLVQPGHGPNPSMEMLDYRQYRCADYPDLASILAAFPADRRLVREWRDADVPAGRASARRADRYWLRAGARARSVRVRQQYS